MATVPLTIAGSCISCRAPLYSPVEIFGEREDCYCASCWFAKISSTSQKSEKLRLLRDEVSALEKEKRENKGLPEARRIIAERQEALQADTEYQSALSISAKSVALDRKINRKYEQIEREEVFLKTGAYPTEDDD